jgi:hypothetical protein
LDVHQQVDDGFGGHPSVNQSAVAEEAAAMERLSINSPSRAATMDDRDSANRNRPPLPKRISLPERLENQPQKLLVYKHAMQLQQQLAAAVKPEDASTAGALQQQQLLHRLQSKRAAWKNQSSMHRSMDYPASMGVPGTLGPTRRPAALQQLRQVSFKQGALPPLMSPQFSTGSQDFPWGPSSQSTSADRPDDLSGQSPEQMLVDSPENLTYFQPSNSSDQMETN